MSNVNEIEFNKVCRTCLTRSEDMKSLFEPCSTATRICFAQMLMSFTPLKFNDTDGLPAQICTSCISEINKFERFQQKCLESNNILQDYIKNDINNIEEILVKCEYSTIPDKVDPEFGTQEDLTKSTNAQNPTNILETLLKKTKKSLPEMSKDVVKQELNVTITIDNENNLQKLIEIGNKEKPEPYPCKVCKKPFKIRSKLLVHLRRHNGEKPYPCTVCKRSYVQKSDLTVHMRTHSGEKPYACTICNASFNLKPSLKYHMLAHSGEKPYACTVCDSTFTQKQSLDGHLRAHLGEKPYTCTVCDSAFNQRQSLTRHLQLHSGEKPFSCLFCDETFSQKQALKRHIRKHFGGKSFTCTVCKTAFQNMSNLRKHLQTHNLCFGNDGLPAQICVKCVGDVIRFHTFVSRSLYADRTLRGYLKKVINAKETALNYPTTIAKACHIPITEVQNDWEESKSNKMDAVEFQSLSIDAQLDLVPEMEHGKELELVKHEIVDGITEWNEFSSLTNKRQLNLLTLIEARDKEDFVKTEIDLEVSEAQPVMDSLTNPQNAECNELDIVKHEIDLLDAHLVKKEMNQEMEVNTKYEVELFNASVQIIKITNVSKESSTQDVEDVLMKNEISVCPELTIALPAPNVQNQNEMDEEILKNCEEVTITTVTNSISLPDDKNHRPYHCTICDSMFKHEESLTYHLRRHAGLKPYSCTFCDSAFATKPELTEHLLKHPADKGQTCKICKKIITCRYFKLHMRMHAENTYACKSCDKAFIKHQYLKKHIQQLHSVAPVFVCSICSSSFNYKRNLAMHMRSHTGKRPYTCTICGTVFAQRNHLTWHLTNHMVNTTGEKSYSCLVCDNSFTEKTELTEHMKVHIHSYGKGS